MVTKGNRCFDVVSLSKRFPKSVDLNAASHNQLFLNYRIPESSG